jgi:hypothetical protein
MTTTDQAGSVQIIDELYFCPTVEKFHRVARATLLKDLAQIKVLVLQVFQTAYRWQKEHPELFGQANAGADFIWLYRSLQQRLEEATTNEAIRRGVEHFLPSPIQTAEDLMNCESPLDFIFGATEFMTRDSTQAVTLARAVVPVARKYSEKHSIPTQFIWSFQGLVDALELWHETPGYNTPEQIRRIIERELA